MNPKQYSMKSTCENLKIHLRRLPKKKITLIVHFTTEKKWEPANRGTTSSSLSPGIVLQSLRVLVCVHEIKAPLTVMEIALPVLISMETP